jgi:glycosyltransferase involved in cell wall biosynthesis
MSKSIKSNKNDKNDKIYVFTKKKNFLNELIELEEKTNGNIIYLDGVLKKNDHMEIKIIVMFDFNDELFEFVNKENFIIFLDKKENLNLDLVNDCILFDSIDYLAKCINVILLKEEKTFTVLVPVYNSTKYLNRCLKSIYNQTYNRFKIFICDDFSNDEEYSKLLKYNKLPNLSIFRNTENHGKFITLNNSLDNIKTDYFLILDSDDVLNKNRLLLDFIHFKEYKKIACVQSKYVRKNDQGQLIVKAQFGHTSITYKTKIINKIGYFCPNRFGSDTEYFLRIKKYFGNKSILQYNFVTYEAFLRDDNTNLTVVYDENIRKIFFNRIMHLLRMDIKMETYCKKNLNYFIELSKSRYTNEFEPNMYKKFYKDLEQMDFKKLKEHWETIGKIEGRLDNMYMFEKYFPNFNYKVYFEQNNTNIRFDNKYQIYGWVYLKNKTNYKKWLDANGFNNYVKTISTHSNQIVEPIDLNEYIKKNNIRFVYVSKSLEHFEKRVMEKFNLLKYSELSDKFDNVLFFGLYEVRDYLMVTQHIGNKFLMWGGTDANIKYNYRNKVMSRIAEYYDIKNLSISPHISKSLQNFNINYVNVYLNMVNKDIFKPTDKSINKPGHCIYIYNGFTKGNEDIYGQTTYTKVINLLSEFKFIMSNELAVEYEQMPEIYSRCFIGLRLTEHDGNANTVQEFNSMNIPIIYNGEGGICWNNVNEIVEIIKKFIPEDMDLSANIYKPCIPVISNKQIEVIDKEIIPKTNKNIKEKIKMYDEVKEIDFSQDIDLEDLDSINKNIENFINLFDGYDKILFICGDYPGYGGASTNCDKLQDLFISNDFETFAIYFNYQYQDEKDKKFESNQKYKIICQKDLNTELAGINVTFVPDIVILKSNVSIDLRIVFKCPIINLIPGIFNGDLDKYHTELRGEEYDKYINKFTLKQITNTEINFTNSSHTKLILQNKYNIKTFLFYSSFVSYYKKEVFVDKKFSNRKYDFGVVISNFDRVIKNVPSIINFLSTKSNVILIGKNNSKYKLDGFVSVNNNVITNLDSYYKKIKCVVNLSFFESCSNVMVEAIFNGCVWINKNKISNDLSFLNSNSNQIELIKSNFYNFKKKTILFVSIYKNNKQLGTLLQISDIIKNENTDIKILLFVGVEYYKQIGLLANKFYSDKFYSDKFYTTWIDKSNNYDKVSVGKILDLDYDKIYLFDYRLPLLLNPYVSNNNLYQLCLIDNIAEDNNEMIIRHEIENYFVKKMTMNKMYMCLGYRLEKFLNEEEIKKNVYLKNNIENNLYNTILTFGLE